jgi:parallel beta-helix repeat protein
MESKVRRARLCRLALIITTIATTEAAAREVHVDTSTALVAAIDTARPGDEIILADGVYRLQGSHGAECRVSGTLAEPIVVRAARPLRAHIESVAIEAFRVDAPNWWFEDLDIKGACDDDSACEHAFHVIGRAAGFRMLRNRVVDFNAQLKVNADAGHNKPEDGLVEANEIYNTHARNTANPVTPLDLDNTVRWIVRGNVIHDFHKSQGNQTSYGAFAKGGSKAPVFERNLILCSLDDKGAGTRIGLSLGGGGMAPAQCSPAWSQSVSCDPEVEDGIIRNNIIVNCSDVGIYLNRARNTKVLYNTLIATAGINFRFKSSTGDANGNLLSGDIHRREGGSYSGSDNLANVSERDFAAWYRNPMRGDLRKKGRLDMLIGKSDAVVGVTDDYCGRRRAGRYFDLGALQASLGDCKRGSP